MSARWENLGPRLDTDRAANRDNTLDVHLSKMRKQNISTIKNLPELSALRLYVRVVVGGALQYLRGWLDLGPERLKDRLTACGGQPGEGRA